MKNMKKLLLLFPLIMLSAIACSQINIGGLPAVTAKYGTDVLALEQSDATRKLSLLQLYDDVTLTGSLTIPSPFTLGSTSVTTNGTRLNYFSTAGGTTGTLTSNVVFSNEPIFTGWLKIGSPVTDTVATREYARTMGGGGGSMTYPGSGIAVSTGSAWATSITNSLGLDNNISDNTGSGALVFGTSPTFTTSITLGTSIVDPTEFGILEGALISTTELNLLNGALWSTSESNKLVGLTSNIIEAADTAMMLANYIREAEVAAQYASLSSPTFTGTVTIPSPFTLGSTSVTASGSEINVLDDMTSSTIQLNYLDEATGITGTSTSNVVFSASPTFTGTTLLGNINVGSGGVVSKWAITLDDGICALDSGGDTLYYKNPVSTEVDIDTVAYILTDTIPLFNPVLGVGNVNDTLAFTLNNKFWGIDIDGSHSIVITKVKTRAQGTSPDIDINFYFATDYSSGSPTTVLTSDLTVNSTTTGNSTTGIANGTVTAGNVLYGKVTEATAKPTQLIITIYGYRIETE